LGRIVVTRCDRPFNAHRSMLSLALFGKCEPCHSGKLTVTIEAADYPSGRGEVGKRFFGLLGSFLEGRSEAVRCDESASSRMARRASASLSWTGSIVTSIIPRHADGMGYPHVATITAPSLP